MTASSKLKNLSALVLLYSFGSAAATEVRDNNARAPEAAIVSIDVEANAELTFWDIPLLEESYVDSAPEARDDGLTVGELGVDSGNRQLILELAQEISSGQHGDFDSLLIAHRGKLLFESYFLRGRINLHHPQTSATKSYISLAVGRALQLGYLTATDLDRPLVSFLEGLDPSRFASGADLITLRNAMSMRSGIRVSDEQIEELERNPDQLTTEELIQAFLERSRPITSDSQTFNYRSPDPMMVMQVLDAVVPGTARDFIRSELLNRMGITNYSWRPQIGGLPEGAGASITSRDMIKWGTLVLNDGAWNGEQLVPEGFVANMTGRLVRLGDDEIFFTGENVSNPGYGFFWWYADMEFDGASYSTTSAQGGGGQHIIVIEELDLVVVSTAHGDADTMQLTAERILPAFLNR